MTALADLISESLLLLLVSLGNGVETHYCTHFIKFAFPYFCVLLCKSTVFLKILAMIVRKEQDGNCS